MGSHWIFMSTLTRNSNRYCISINFPKFYYFPNCWQGRKINIPCSCKQIVFINFQRLTYLIFLSITAPEKFEKTCALIYSTLFNINYNIFNHNFNSRINSKDTTSIILILKQANSAERYILARYQMFSSSFNNTCSSH